MADRPHIIHLHGTEPPTLERLLEKNVQLGEIVVQHGEEEQALYILYESKDGMIEF